MKVLKGMKQLLMADEYFSILAMSAVYAVVSQVLFGLCGCGRGTNIALYETGPMLLESMVV